MRGVDPVSALWYRPAPMALIGRFLAGSLAASAFLAAALLGGWSPLREGSMQLQLQAGRSQPVGRILYVRDGNIWLWQEGGTRQLTTGETWRQPAFSPDGATIAYVYRGQNFSDIFVMKDDGSDNRRLTQGQARVLDDNDWVFRPAWTPDGAQITYLADTGTPFLQPWTMNTEGGARRQLQLGGVFDMVDSIAWALMVSDSPLADSRLAQLGKLYPARSMSGNQARHLPPSPRTRTARSIPPGRRMASGWRTRRVTALAPMFTPAECPKATRPAFEAGPVPRSGPGHLMGNRSPSFPVRKAASRSLSSMSSITGGEMRCK